MTDTCEDCNGSGIGPCDNCGDSYADCRCDDPSEPECPTCGGTGEVDDDDDEGEGEDNA